MGKEINKTKKRKLSFTTRYIMFFGIMMLVITIILGIVILFQSSKAMRTMVNQNMSNLAETAAAFVDGDALEALTESDTDSPAYKEILEDLGRFQAKADIHYIYAVRRTGEGLFVFVVDPDPEDPADFGEEIVVTDGLIQAGNGNPAVDSEPVADEWGNFYSAYSPVFDSQGQVAGVIGVDFDSEWYDREVQKHLIIIGIFVVLIVILVAVMVVLFTNRVRRRFDDLDEDLSALSDNIDELLDEVVAISGYQNGDNRKIEPEGDELEILGQKIHAMQNDMVVSLEYLHSRAYFDALTDVHNTMAYHERIREIEDKIREGSGFEVCVFDINSLKEINDTFGHERGDLIIQGAARTIVNIFGRDATFRIGGDEFAVITETSAPYQEQFDRLQKEVDRFNREHGFTGIACLAIAMGIASLRPGQDASYKDIFERADKMMYENKRRHYAGQPQIFD